MDDAALDVPQADLDAVLLDAAESAAAHFLYSAPKMYGVYTDLLWNAVCAFGGVEVLHNAGSRREWGLA